MTDFFNYGELQNKGSNKASYRRVVAFQLALIEFINSFQIEVKNSSSILNDDW